MASNHAVPGTPVSAIFGLSLIGLRSVAVLAEALVMFLTGVMIRDLGGKRWAQILGSVSVATTPNSIIQAGLFQYETFDYLCWILLACTVIRLLKTQNPRWWLAIGAAIGLGMMTKYTIAVLVIGMIAGVLVTHNRRYLESRWLWAGVLLALLIWLPNLAWEFQNHWISLDFLAAIHTRDVQSGLTSLFLINQLEFNLNPVMLLLVAGGLYFFFFAPGGQRYRMLGWMYLVPLILLLVLQGKGYYLAPAYPMLAAGGAAWWEQRLARLSNQGSAYTWRRIAWGFVGAFAVLFITTELPIAPLGSAWWQVVSNSNPELKSEVGWPQLVQQVAQAYDSLPEGQKSHVGILAFTSGETGSIDIFGPAYGLPRVISGFNSYWSYGYGNPPPLTVLVVGASPDFLANFQSCSFISSITTPFNIQNDEAVTHRMIYVCNNLLQPWPEFWQKLQYFG